MLKSICVTEVIEAKVLVGKGTEEDPNRIVTQFWSTDGELLAVNDPGSISSVHRTSLDQ